LFVRFVLCRYKNLFDSFIYIYKLVHFKQRFATAPTAAVINVFSL